MAAIDDNVSTNRATLIMGCFIMFIIVVSASAAIYVRNQGPRFQEVRSYEAELNYRQCLHDKAGVVGVTTARQELDCRNQFKPE